ncbi:S1C family serine protease [Kovacikia minuta CCNUW1]|uniref:S1C family serine protease n=1 Tax=Kovacikia minuta TaxID=2931930 RepID=UPI001CCB5B5F|nr:trypsin-like peptidase domain-containing protein [Kovacikia minuta]UBF25041.1 S1C family serine protease [Kovacikia minuta CCNUW1]
MTTSSYEGSSVLLALSNQLADIVELVGSSVVAVNARRRRSSSGVYWQQGIVVTADHTVNQDEEITVTLPDNRTLPATLVGRDAGTDLAVLRVDADGDLSSLKTAEIGDAATLKVVHMALAIARSHDSGTSASLGVISALSGSWRSWHGGRIDQFIRPSLAVYSGFSGSALVDTSGQVVGINTAGPRQSALTIPASTVNRVVNQLLQGGRIARGYLGLGMQPVRLPETLRRSLNLSQPSGVIVVSVEAEAPADKAGVLIGDILIALNTTPVNDVSDVHAKLDSDQVGKPLVAQIIRGGAIAEVTITIGERPTKEA